MDGNKDDALKCLRVGKEALQSGDRTRALKFLNKARRLDPSLPIDDLLSTAKESSHNPKTDAESSTAGSSSSSPSSSSARVRVSSKGSAAKDYTEEQLTIVHQIKKQKDYYQILGLERSCTVEDVRKAYRKLSLKVHPDKNKAPGAEEAFKAVSKAFQCLSNEETKKRYDLVGSEEPNYGRAPSRQHSHGFNGFNGFYDDEFDPDEIFRNFFGGGPRATTPFGTFHFRTGGINVPNGNGTNNSGNGNLRAIIQMLPVILLILVNFLPSSDPVYTLSRNHPYVHKIETPRGVAYFVKSLAKFEKEYPYDSSQRKDLERRVERDYVGVVSQNCRVEMQRYHWGLVRETPHCDMLEKYQATA
ncbi:uncharacterized protein A4U43_C06F10130 [Asparagus officinalis]|uniref:J domain-containing protein n=1 Tax=Asparagus officinalis TaxID=4686 RepID=A0A5P1EP88_ASPOF|nr:chaperone protein dnaJ 49-like [Asparagus officinalis]XP_020269013.1 chaperone protein dnaJ 49-like [Asparagus officinalis]XP_020269014.1 chaperone protein dnaJ 49-like [Asparagus officinalis]XP_020269015.1 chaperone protein dnaJ 49-like [Asparagus officinalis]XP_020269016.1 chaperone protein dnaJ 49-like [Asparagus officinalis]XP_020269017.1 chaperone protein dnaJ 49-like [Asparagus officinalis]ONK66609.1 uncharacterized protein A4U43_C06F10130 [Asparagus officinalis]